MFQSRPGESIEQSHPKIEIIEMTDLTLRFILSDCDVSVANALRRVMIAEVPTMAIHFVDMIENTSPLMDEMLAQRLGLIPLYSVQADQKLYDWEVEGEASSDDLTTRAIFTLKVKNMKDEPLEVTNRDLKPDYGAIGQDAILPVKYFSSLNPKLEAEIPIIKLGKNQSVHVRCHALKGFGKMHAKWTPVNIASFSYEADILIDQQMESTLNQEQKQEIVQSCPTKVFDINAKTGNIDIVNSNACIYCEECVRKVETFKIPRMIKLSTKPNKYIFYVESTGQLKASDIVQKAFAVLRNKLENLNHEFQKTLSNIRRV